MDDYVKRWKRVQSPITSDKSKFRKGIIPRKKAVEKEGDRIPLTGCAELQKHEMTRADIRGANGNQGLKGSKLRVGAPPRLIIVFYLSWELGDSWVRGVTSKDSGHLRTGGSRKKKKWLKIEEP